MTLRPLRITSLAAKCVFAVAAYAVEVLAQFPIGAFAGEFDGAAMFAVIFLILIVGARLFRIPGEPIAPPRPWWKATGRPTLSLVLGGLAVWCLTIEFNSIIFATMDDVPGLIAVRSIEVFTALVALFYLNSGAHHVVILLRRRGAALDDRVP